MRQIDRITFLTAPMLILLIIVSLSLSSCGSTPAPVISRSPPPDQKIKHHIVSPGDTLFAIAWRYELSVQSLAAVNGLTQPYAIYAGQRLMLDTSNVSRNSSKVKRIQSAQIAVAQVGRSSTAKNVKKMSNQAIKKTTGISGKRSSKLPKKGWRWGWPVQGAVSRRYDTNRVFKGLDIMTEKGRAVKTAAPGVVVYAGRGLRGYGQLLIIKHSDAYLSAYAHNHKMYVKEGQSIGVGQKIAEVGGDPNNSGRLYFEIRKNGKPVDPMRLLPRL